MEGRWGGCGGERGGRGWRVGGGGVLKLLPNFQKGGLDRVLIFRRELLGKRRLPFQGGVQFLHKNELKFETFNDKKFINKIFFSVIIKNLN